MENDNDFNIGLHDKTGAMLMLDKKERALIKELLLITLSSASAKKFISKKLGPEYVKIGAKLLENMGG